MSYEVDYKDERFTEVETDKKAALSEVEKTYGGMINDSDSFYKAQIDASKEWEQKQTQLQQEQTDFAIEQIEQQKDQAKKDYIKEQSGAYVDWQKQKNDYGTEAEKMAEAGLASTGFAESSQVSFYNTYQNRVMTAREAYSRAVLNYDNAIKDARLQNNSALAEIAYNALQKQLELSLAGFQYKNQLLLDKFDKRTQTEDRYHQRYQEVLSQINTENALSEQIRQFNEQMALEREQFEFQKEQTKKASSGGGGGSPKAVIVNDEDEEKTIDNTSGGSSYNVRAGNTDKANRLVSSLQSMQGSMSNKNNTAIANSITAYAATGKINADEAAYMYKKFGLEPRDYFE